MVERKDNGFYGKICEAQITARQQAPQTFEMNASIYAFRPETLERKWKGTILDFSCGIYEMPDYLVFDIDSEEDFEMMRFLLPYYVERDAGLKEIAAVASESMS